jgi:AraC-like DNA-binding protein
MQRGTASTGATYEFFDLACGSLERYRGERLTEFSSTGGGVLSLHWSVGENGIFNLGGADIAIRPGNVVILPPDDQYRIHKRPSSGLRVVRLMLDLDSAPTDRLFLPNSPLASTFARLHAAEVMELDQIAGRVLDWLRAEDGEGRRIETPCARAARLAADVMRADLGAKHLLPELAATVGLSVNHLIRSFRHTFGTTPHAWLKEQRLLRAQTLLPGTSVSDVALQVGWQSPATFSLAFARRFGAPPSQWVISDKSVS